MRRLHAYCLLLLITASLSLPAQPDEDLWKEYEDMGKADVEKSEFQKRFTASYGVLSDVEPELSEVEIALLEKLGPIFDRNPNLAQVMLEGMLREDTPVSATFNMILANIYYSANAYELAEKEYNIAIDKFPDFRRAWTNLGIMFIRLKRWEEAVDAIKKSLALGENRGYIYGSLAYAYLQLQKYRAAESAYQFAIMHDPENPDWLRGLAKCYLDNKKFEMASATLADLQDEDPTNPLYWRLQANAYLGMEQPLKAARNIEILKSMGNAGPNELVLLGNIYALNDAPERSLDNYKLAMSGDEVPDPALILKAIDQFIDFDRHDTALQLFNALSTEKGKWGKDDILRYRLADSELALWQGSQDRALSSLETVLQSNPFYVPALLLAAEVAVAQSDHPLAILYLDRALQANPGELKALLLYSKVLIEERRYDEALPFLERSLQISSIPAIEALYLRVKSSIQATASR